MRRARLSPPARRLPALITGLVLLPLLAGPVAEAVADTPKPVAMVLVLDASGSMNGSDGHGSTKIATAKAAVRTILGQLPADLRVGLMAYGHRVPSTPDHAKACRDVQLVAPVAPLDKAGLGTAVGTLVAKGETPIGLSLQQAAAALPAGASGSVILVSDGDDSCAPPEPCAAAKQLKASGVQLTVDTVGLVVEASAKQQLTCISEATGGTYTDVKDTAQLATSLSSVAAKRAPRLATLAGRPVEGAPTVERAPKIGPGGYLDTFQQMEDLYYAIDVAQGQRLRVVVDIDSRRHQGNGKPFSIALVTDTGEQISSTGEYLGERKVQRATVETRNPVEQSGTLYLELDSGSSVEATEQLPVQFRVDLLGAGASGSPSDPTANPSGAANPSDASASSAGPGQPSATAGASPSGDTTDTPVAAPLTGTGYSRTVLAATGGGGFAAGLLAGAVAAVLLGRRRRAQGRGRPGPPTGYGAPGPGAPGRPYGDRTTLPPPYGG